MTFLLSFHLNADDFDLSLFEKGEKLYSQTCVSCHGVDGTSNTNMRLVVKPRDLTKTVLYEKQIVNIIKDGSMFWGSKADIMPAFKYVYNDNQIKSIAYFVYNKFVKETASSRASLTNTSKETKELSLTLGKKIFKRNCSLCHGIKGDGESIYVEESKSQDNFIYPYNLTKILLNEKQIFLYSKFGGKFWGTDKNDMPSWSQKYNDFELKSVAKYIHEVIQK
ncbi:MAG: c-type cytochrome [Campylobacterota bacterium]|nr:c-type cytochrome [Campylobacterota bacterium]